MPRPNSKFISIYTDHLDCYNILLPRNFKNIIGKNENFKCSKNDIMSKNIASITPKRAEKLLYRYEKNKYEKKYKRVFFES